MCMSATTPLHVPTSTIVRKQSVDIPGPNSAMVTTVYAILNF